MNQNLAEMGRILNAMEEMDIPAVKVFLNNIYFVLVTRGDSYFVSLEKGASFSQKGVPRIWINNLISKRSNK